MNDTRQDAWTEDEDIILANTVLQFIRKGKTQLEAFKEVANQLSRTSAACGFRWNATIRKLYEQEIQSAKEERKNGVRKETVFNSNNSDFKERYTIDSAIQLLEKMRLQFPDEKRLIHKEYEEKLQYFQKENDLLKSKLLRYDNAWQEMSKLWAWVKNGD